MPLAVIGDFFLGHSAKAQVVFGAILVLASFVVVGIEDSKVEGALVPPIPPPPTTTSTSLDGSYQYQYHPHSYPSGVRSGSLDEEDRREVERSRGRRQSRVRWRDEADGDVDGEDELEGSGGVDKNGGERRRSLAGDRAVEER